VREHFESKQQKIVVIEVLTVAGWQKLFERDAPIKKDYFDEIFVRVTAT
jgi:hypothetical protein